MAKREPTAVESAFGNGYDFVPWLGSPKKSVMIAGLPRTGSTVLCLDLWRTGSAGAPLEYFNRGDPARAQEANAVRRPFGLSYLHSLWVRRTSPNGVFAFKMFLNDLRRMMSDDEELLAHLSSTHVIYLTRLDRLGQAISYARAYRTGKWFFDMAGTDEPAYSRADILMSLRWIYEQESQWENLFERTKCTPLRIFYEEISREGSLINRCLEFIQEGQGSPPTVPVPELRSQADGITSSWKRKFLAGD